MNIQENAERAQIKSDAGCMREWQGSVAHDVYMRHLDALLHDAINAVLNGDQQQFPYLKGIVAGLRHARNLPQTIERTAERVTTFPRAQKTT